MRCIGGRNQAGHNVGVYHFFIITGIRIRGRLFLFHRSDDFDLCKEDAAAVAFPCTVCVFYVVAFSPYTEIAGFDRCFRRQILGFAFGINGFQKVFPVRISMVLSEKSS